MTGSNKNIYINFVATVALVLLALFALWPHHMYTPKEGFGTQPSPTVATSFNQYTTRETQCMNEFDRKMQLLTPAFTNTFLMKGCFQMANMTVDEFVATTIDFNKNNNTVTFFTANQ